MDDYLVVLSDDFSGCLEGDIVAEEDSVFVFYDDGFRISDFEALDDERVDVDWDSGAVGRGVLSGEGEGHGFGGHLEGDSFGLVGVEVEGSVEFGDCDAFEIAEG